MIRFDEETFPIHAHSKFSTHSHKPTAVGQVGPTVVVVIHNVSVKQLSTYPGL